MENTNNKFWLIYFMDLNLNLCFVYHSSGTLKTSMVHIHTLSMALVWYARWNALIICSSYHLQGEQDRQKKSFFDGQQKSFSLTKYFT